MMRKVYFYSNTKSKISFALLTLGLLTACGGSSIGDSSRTDSGGNSSGNVQNWVAGQFSPAVDFADFCENPRTGIDPITDEAFADKVGSPTDENNWLRSITNDLYLWYDEVPDLNPALFLTPEYFDLLMTDAITPSGTPRDQFHFSLPTEEWFELSQGGVSAGYGFDIALIRSAPPRDVVVAYTQPNTPATNANITRGVKIISVDGVSVSTGDADALNAAFFPDTLGESHQFEIQDLESATTRTVTLVSQEVTTVPVQNVKTISTATGNVGYLTFSDHIATAEQQLVSAVNQLAADNISDLVIDLRYNGGGFLYIASQLSYMIAGDAKTSGQTFENITFNDKHPVDDPVTGVRLAPTPFISVTKSNQALPTLNLNRVFLLTGDNTCSASESIINGLRGVDVDVYQIGSTTCGKPYGFYEMPNCGTSYFTIMFSGENAKGFGDYSDGFSPQNTASGIGELIPGCEVADDFTKLLGDETEKRFAGALSYRTQLDSTGSASCSSISSAAPSRIAAKLTDTPVDLSAVNAYVSKPKGLEGKILK